MENKQTAVEWLVKELSQELDYIPIKQWDRIRDLVQQAKAMEKEQIIEAFTKGELVKDNYYDYSNPFNENGINYYNKTYGK